MMSAHEARGSTPSCGTYQTPAKYQRTRIARGLPILLGVAAAAADIIGLAPAEPASTKTVLLFLAFTPFAFTLGLVVGMTLVGAVIHTALEGVRRMPMDAEATGKFKLSLLVVCRVALGFLLHDWGDTRFGTPLRQPRARRRLREARPSAPVRISSRAPNALNLRTQ